MALPEKTCKRCENPKCGLFKKKLSTREKVCSCGWELKSCTIGKNQFLVLVLLILVAGGMIGGWYYYPKLEKVVAEYFSHAPSGEKSSEPNGANNKKILVDGTTTKIPTTPVPSTPVLLAPNYEKKFDELNDKFQSIQTALEGIKTHQQAEKEEIVALITQLKIVEGVVKSTKEGLSPLQKQIEEIQTTINNPLLDMTTLKTMMRDLIKETLVQELQKVNTKREEIAQLRQMLLELARKLEKPNPELVEIKQAIQGIQTELTKQFGVTLAEIRTLTEQLPSDTDWVEVKQKINGLGMIQMVQAIQLQALKTNYVDIQMQLNALAESLTPVSRIKLEEWAPSLKFAIKYSYRQRGHGAYLTLEENTILGTGDELKVTFTPAQESYVYLFQENAQGECYLLHPDSDYSFNPVQADHTYNLPGETEDFILENEAEKGRQTFYFRASTQPIDLLENYSQTEEDVATEYCHPMVNLRVTNAFSDSNLCEECAKSFTFIYQP